MAWRPFWLEEQERMERENTEPNKKVSEPPVYGDVNVKPLHVPTVFSNAADYCR